MTYIRCPDLRDIICQLLIGRCESFELTIQLFFTAFPLIFQETRGWSRLSNPTTSQAQLTYSRNRRSSVPRNRYRSNPRCSPHPTPELLLRTSPSQDTRRRVRPAGSETPSMLYRSRHPPYRPVRLRMDMYPECSLGRTHPRFCAFWRWILVDLYGNQ